MWMNRRRSGRSKCMRHISDVWRTTPSEVSRGAARSRLCRSAAAPLRGSAQRFGVGPSPKGRLEQNEFTGRAFQACSRHATLDQGYRHDLQRPRRLDRRQRAPGRRARSRPCRAHRRRPGRAGAGPRRRVAAAVAMGLLHQRRGPGWTGDGWPSLARRFLPPAHDRNRMWAGGRSNSSGRSGSACRPSACPRWPTSRKRPAAQVRCCSSPCATNTARTERPRSWRNRTSSTASPRRQAVRSEPAPEAQWRDPVEPTSVLLFRYSAVTFNGHRIHYDHPYVTTVEGYPGLVVHGPLIATEMVAAFVRAHPQARLKHLSYRGLRPLISPTPFHVAGRLERFGAGQAVGRAGRHPGAPGRTEVRGMSAPAPARWTASPSSAWSTPSPRRSAPASWPTWARA